MVCHFVKLGIVYSLFGGLLYLFDLLNGCVGRYIVFLLFGGCVHALVSLVYHYYRAKSIFAEYYSKKVLSATGTSIKEDTKIEISPKEFKERLFALREEIIELNQQPDLIQKKNTRGLYCPEDKVWEVAREAAAFFGGGRAVFLQLAHPYVASGVKQHSRVADDIQKRFYNTFHHMFRLSFGDLKEAEKSARQVRSIHERINGTLDSSPPFAEGSLYTANHQGALIWVWATLVDTSMLMFELLVQRMSHEEKEEYYKGQKEFVRFFGLEPNCLPSGWNEFMDYTAKMWNSDILCVSETAKEADESLFRPNTFLSKIVNGVTRRITFSLLPRRIAHAYGVYPTCFDDMNLLFFFASSRMIYSSLPFSLRFLTAAMDAETRITGINRYSPLLSSFAGWMTSLVMNNLIMNPSQNVNEWNDSKTKKLIQ